VRGWDPPHFDPHLTTASFTQSTLSFVYSILVRHQVDAEIPPGAFIVEPDLAERWEEPNDTTYVFYLRKGVRWHNKPPVSGREPVAEDVKFTYDRFLTEKRNMARSPIGWCANRTWRRSRGVSHLVYRAFLASNTGAIMMRTDRPPFTNVRGRRAISHAIDRQGLIRAVWAGTH
jgi:ABC-type transport system substrate-binding protein